MRWIRVPGYLFLLGCLSVLAFSMTAQAEPRDQVPVTGKAHAELVSFDRMMQEFLPKYKIPGAALAVAKDGQLLYQRGFGYADTDAKVAVKPGDLFRIASISKPITAAAVLQLIERGQLKTDDKVFNVLGLIPPNDPNVKFDERWRKVTILHLLHHAGGWDRDKAFDPMFHSPAIVKELKIKGPAGPEDIIRYMLRKRLQFEPGERYEYSNFGYCLLGRVIEKVSGQRYEDYVRKEVLAPLGISRMRIGHTLARDRAPGEVRYYSANKDTGTALLGPRLGQQVPWQYGGWYLEAMDSHGAWIASAGDLVRFAAAFNDPAQCKILSAKSIELMFAPPPGSLGHKANGKPKASFYACGWNVRPYPNGLFNSWHDGSLEGTSTILVRRTDNLTWAVLFNTRDGDGKAEPAGLIDPLVHQAADEVKTWPRE